MKIINRKEINSKDWKDFIKWADEGKFLLGNKNLLSQLFSINKDFNFESSLIEFFIYNHHILRDRYSLEIPQWLAEHKRGSIEETVSSLMKEFLKEDAWRLFESFYLKLVYYLVETNKDNDREYELALMYNEFIERLSKEQPDYNKWIEYLSKNIHIDLKGYKK